MHEVSYEHHIKQKEEIKKKLYISKNHTIFLQAKTGCYYGAEAKLITLLLIAAWHLDPCINFLIVYPGNFQEQHIE